MAQNKNLIKVDRQRMQKTVKVIRDFVDIIKRENNSAESAIADLKTAWKGSDANAFFSTWEKVKQDETAYKNAIVALESYANFLDYAAEQYRNAQEQAYAKAKRL